MLKDNSSFNEYDSMSIKDLKKEMKAVRANICKLNTQIKCIKRKRESQFSFLLYPPPKSEPSILKQAADIEILASSPKFHKNEEDAEIRYYIDVNEKKRSRVNPEKIRLFIQEKMNMDLSVMVENHNHEVSGIEFGHPSEASIAKYFPK